MDTLDLASLIELEDEDYDPNRPARDSFEV
ncbi:MAG: hypothetical protein QG601_209 [Pseudomonadota bacterium]|nr:hypothetical protein [Pseudomonadota bacterium]